MTEYLIVHLDTGPPKPGEADDGFRRPGWYVCSPPSYLPRGPFIDKEAAVAAAKHRTPLITGWTLMPTKSGWSLQMPVPNKPRKVEG
jgi:hypothetical protein